MPVRQAPALGAQYATLGVPKYATESEVRRAYKNLALRAHPDKGGDKDRFDEIQKAYDAILAKWAREKDERKKAFAQFAARKAPAKPPAPRDASAVAEPEAEPEAALPIRQGEDQQVLVPSSDLKELGDEAYVQGDFERALEYYNTAAAFGRVDNLLKFAELYEARARTHGRLGDWARSLDDASRACGLRPIWLPSLLAKGEALERLEQWAAARDTYERAVGLDRRSAEAAAGLARAEGALVTLSCRAVLHGHTAPVTKVAFRPAAEGCREEEGGGGGAGACVATASEDGTSRVWSADGTCLHVLKEHGGAVVDLAWCPSGRAVLATASADGLARLWDVPAGGPPAAPLPPAATLEGHEAGLTSVSFDPSGALLATTSRDCTAWVWDVTAPQSPSLSHALAPLHKKAVTRAAFSPDGRSIATASDDEDGRVWDLAGDLGEAGDCVHTLRWESGRVNDIAYTPDGRFIVIATHQPDANKKFYRLLVWSAVSGRICRWYDGHSGIITSLSWHPRCGARDGKTGRGGAARLATGSWDGTVMFWDICGEPAGPGPCAGEVGDFRGRKLVRGTAEVLMSGGVHEARYSPDGRAVATASEDGFVRVFESKTGRCREAWAGHAGAVRSVSWAPGGALLATASEDGTARVWAAPAEPAAPLVLLAPPPAEE